MKYINLFISISMLSISCSKSTEISKDKICCFSFDERQCGVDPFASLGVSDTERKTKIETYLANATISISELNIVDPFYEATCDACEICPEDHKYFIKISELDTSKLNSLNLFNLKREDCDEVF